MKLITTIWLIAGTALAAAACTEGPIGPVADEDDGVVSVAGDETLDNFLNNPDNGNPRIFRIESEAFIVLFDDTPGSTLAAVHSSFPDCGGTLKPVALQEVLHNPDDPFFDRVIVTLQAKDINIWVVDVANPGPCFGVELVAGGTGKLQITDNDLFARGPSNANAYGYMAQATLSTPSGSRAHYNALQRTTWKRDAFNNIILDQITEKLNLKIN